MYLVEYHMNGRMFRRLVVGSLGRAAPFASPVFRDRESETLKRRL